MNTLTIYSVDVTAKKAFVDRFYRNNIPSTLRFYVPAVSAKDAAFCISEMMDDGELLSGSLTNIKKWYCKPHSTQCSAYKYIDLDEASEAGYLEHCFINEFSGYDSDRCVLHIHPARSAAAYAELIEKYYSRQYSYWRWNRIGFIALNLLNREKKTPRKLARTGNFC